jgi:hypothetical protein
MELVFTTSNRCENSASVIVSTEFAAAELVAPMEAIETTAEVKNSFFMVLPFRFRRRQGLDNYG